MNTMHRAQPILFRNTMHILDGHLEEFRDAITRAVDVAEEHGPQLMVQTFIDEDQMLAHSFQLYRDSDAVRMHWRLSDPYIQEVMEHCVVEHFEAFGRPDADVADGLASVLDDSVRTASHRSSRASPASPPDSPTAPGFAIELAAALRIP